MKIHVRLASQVSQDDGNGLAPHQLVNTDVEFMLPNGNIERSLALIAFRWTVAATFY